MLTPDEAAAPTEWVAGEPLFERLPVPDAAIEDLDVERFRREYLPRVMPRSMLAADTRTAAEQLASLHLLDAHTGRPTFVGILVAGRDPVRWMPGAYVQFVRLQGTDRAAPVPDSHVLSENLMGLAQMIDRLFRIQIHFAHVPAQGGRYVDVPDYPIEAVRELIVNAVMHRSYPGANAPTMVYWFSDRVEILSPGGLFSPATPENFGTQMAHRNPVIAGALQTLGLVGEFGTGIKRVREALAKNGNPPPEFQFDTYVLATIRPRPSPIPKGSTLSGGP